MIDRTPLTFADLEFKNGILVKVRGMRYNHMNRDDLVWLVGELGRLLCKENKLTCMLWESVFKINKPSSDVEK